MNLSDIIPTADQIKLAQGIERELLQRRRTGSISGIVAITWAILQILISVRTHYIKNIGLFIINLFSGQWAKLIGPNSLSINGFAGLLVLIIAAGTYFLFRWTNFHLKEAVEPFRYTFWIDQFQPVAQTPGNRCILNNKDQFHLLHHDLMEWLNKRIKRFSLLNSDKDLLPDAKKNLTSHIHISGHYAIREKKDGNWIIQIMPRVRVGSIERPSTLANFVKFYLHEMKPQKNKGENSKLQKHSQKNIPEYDLRSDQYNQIVERVYSSIATEIYRQIKSDMKAKISLFPTGYLRAVALFHEAKDFERSNTIDSYDCAIELYRESMRYFDIANIKLISQCLMKIPLPILWRKERKFLYMDARTRIGYSRCIIYRRVISALSGRSKNPLFEIRNQLDEAINSLEKLHKKFKKGRIWKLLLLYKDRENNNKQTRAKNRKQLYSLMSYLTYPRDSFLRRSKPIFDKIRESLFDAHAVSALAYYYLGAIKKGKESLDDAQAVSPDLSVKDPLYLLASAEIEADLDKEILLFKQAADLAPDFEIAQYRLAYYSEMRFRLQNELTKTRANSVLNAYEDVLRINPGNIASLAAQGYLLWLLGNKEAKEKFEEGCDIKATVRQTFIGELNYGLARIAAEKGNFNTCYDKYIQAISSDPGIGAYSFTAGNLKYTSYYDYIGSSMLKKRYEPYKGSVLKKIKKLEDKIKNHEKTANKKKIRDNEEKEVSLKTLKVIRVFLLNDYGNACLNYFHRFGDREQLKKAINAYKQATKIDSENSIAHYNLHNAYAWRKDPNDNDSILKSLDKAENLASAWPVVLIASAQYRLAYVQDKILKMLEEACKEIEEALSMKIGLKDTEELLEDLLVEKGGKGIPEYSKVASKVTKPKKSNSIEEQEKIQKRVKHAIELYINANREKKEQVKNVLSKAHKIINRTKISSMFKGMGFKVDGEWVEALLSKKIEGDRLDENDVEALRIWANILSNNYQEEETIQEKTLRAAEKLSNYILTNYYPDDYEINMILQTMYKIKSCDYRFRLKFKKVTGQALRGYNGEL